VLLCKRQKKLLKSLKVRRLSIKASEFLGVPPQHLVALSQEALLHAFDIRRC